MANNIETIKKILIEGNHTCVVMTKDGQVITSDESGIKPLMRLVILDGKSLPGAYIADKVIGRAAAAILVHSGAAECYGALMSETAIELFDESGITYSYGKKVPFIKNRDNTGLCPMENMTLGLDAQQGYETLYNFFSDKKLI